MFIKILLLSFLIGAGQSVFAQEDWEETGEIEDAQVIIEKDRKIELPAANRTYEKVPPSEENKQIKPQQYNFNEFLYEGNSYSPDVKINRLTPENSVNSNNNFVKVGFGNYISPLAEVSLNTTKNKLTAGLSFNHLSFARGPVDGSNSGSSDNQGNLYAILNNQKSAISLDLDFNSTKRYYYGFSDGSRTEINPLKQKYNTFGLKIGIRNSDQNSAFDYSFKTGFYTLNDNFNAKENGFTGQLKVSAPIVDNISLFSEIDALITNYDDVTDINRNVVKIKGGVGYELDRLSIKAAANIALTNDTISNSNDFKLYPYFTANYQLSDKWSLSGGLVGDLEAVTLKTLSNENPFIAQGIPLNHTNKQIELFGKISGKLSQQLDLKTGLSYANYENLYFYSDTLRFNLAYEEDATDVINIFTEVNFTLQSNFAINTRFDFFNYSTKTLPEAWHRPTFISNISARYTVNKKLFIGSSLSVISGIKSFNPTTGTSEKLDSVLDLGFNANYQINDRLSAFSELNNILSKKYERYINYINRSFMVHAGISFSF